MCVPNMLTSDEEEVQPPSHQGRSHHDRGRSGQSARPRRRTVARAGQTLYQSHGKRSLDLALGVPALVAASPLIGLVALLVRLKLGSPVFFRLPRAGLGGRPFIPLKFRSMIVARDSAGDHLPMNSQEAYASARSGERLTGFGAFLRRTALDELPSLWNVVRGEMSLVGPRPLVLEYLDRYTPEQRRRHEVKPGLTGWAQIHGRQALPWEDRFEHDAWYVDHFSLRLDAEILFSTPRVLLSAVGVSEPGYATGTEFMGSTPRATP